MKRLWNMLRRAWIQYDIAVLRDALDEQQRQVDFWPVRKKRWQQMLAERQADLSALDRNRKKAQFLLSGLRSARHD